MAFIATRHLVFGLVKLPPWLVLVLNDGDGYLPGEMPLAPHATQWNHHAYGLSQPGFWHFSPGYVCGVDSTTMDFDIT